MHFDPNCLQQYHGLELGNGKKLKEWFIKFKFHKAAECSLNRLCTQILGDKPASQLQDSTPPRLNFGPPMFGTQAARQVGRQK